MTDTVQEPQTVTREVDIPDAEAARKKTVVLPAKTQVERDIRRYIRKDGVFVKDLECMWDVDTGKRDSSGNMIRTATKTKEEAEKIVIELCEKTGRKVEKDPTSGRLRAVPGWDLAIHVPGMLREEANAPKAPEGEARMKINDNMLVALQKENQELKDTLAKQAEAMAKLNERLDSMTLGGSAKTKTNKKK
jgi:hypothetical protein